MNYRQEYEKWLASPALSEDERNELKAIANDEKEIENRFYGPLEFGTAGLRGTMYVVWGASKHDPPRDPLGDAGLCQRHPR